MIFYLGRRREEIGQPLTREEATNIVAAVCDWERGKGYSIGKTFEAILVDLIVGVKDVDVVVNTIDKHLKEKLRPSETEGRFV